MAAIQLKRRIRISVGMKISFTYLKLNGEMRQVDNFVVDNIYRSKKGYRMIQGWREDGEGRTYRRERMTNVVDVG